MLRMEVRRTFLFRLLVLSIGTPNTWGPRENQSKLVFQ